MLSVVVPTFNEGKNIRNLVTQIDDALKGIPYEIVFVDDSKDDTPQVIMEVAKDFPAVRMEHRTGETGLATAVLKGFSLAKGEYMACMDADLQHPPIVLSKRNGNGKTAGAGAAAERKLPRSSKEEATYG